MGARHSGREAALQMLFQIEVSGATADGAIDLFWRNFLDGADPEGRDYADAIVKMQQQESTLQAVYSTTAKLFDQGLLDFIR